VKHQQLLTEMNLSTVFSRKNQDYATWCTFIFAIVINVLFVVYYDASTGPAVINNGMALKVIYVLNLTQTIVASFVLLLWLVVRTPVEYQSIKESGKSEMRTIFLTATEPYTMYYFFYLVLSILGLTVADYYLPFLLLDIIVKNSTTRDVLNAVIIPWRQLIMTLILALFMTYIYSYFLFLYYGQDIGGIWGVGVFPNAGENDCHLLFGCFKFALSYGLRQGGGLTDVLNMSINHGRWLIDETYFLLVIIMLLNIIFGIIIDTFSSLRAEKDRRLEDTEGVCFICGIDKQIFDRASDEPDGFENHVKLDHNMWNYLYFIFLLWEQDKDDDDGMEQYVRRAIEADEIIWFPLNKAIRLDHSASAEEVVLGDIHSKLKIVEDNLVKKLTNFESELNFVMEQLSAATKMDYKRGEVKLGIAEFLQRQAGMNNLADDGADSLVESVVADENVEVVDDDNMSVIEGIDTDISAAFNTGTNQTLTDGVADYEAKYPMFLVDTTESDDRNDSCSIENDVTDTASLSGAVSNNVTNTRTLGTTDSAQEVPANFGHLDSPGTIFSDNESNQNLNLDNDDDFFRDDDVTDFLQLSDKYAGGKLKVKSIALYGSRSSPEFCVESRQCYLTVNATGHSFATSSKALLKGKKSTWSNLSMFANYNFPAILTESIVVELWDASTKECIASCVFRLIKFSSHIDADVDTTISLLSPQGVCVAKVILVAKFTPVKRLDLVVGDAVRARYLGGKGKWHTGRISSDRGDGSYGVDYDDGDYEWNVREDVIELIAAGGDYNSQHERSSVFKFGDSNDGDILLESKIDDAEDSNGLDEVNESTEDKNLQDAGPEKVSDWVENIEDQEEDALLAACGDLLEKADAKRFNASHDEKV